MSKQGKEKKPLKRTRSSKLLAFTVGCSIGPIIIEGQTDTTLSPLLSAYSKASDSAIVLPRE